jgi:hypothetical protein
MQPRRTGRTIVLVVLLVVLAGAGVLAAEGKLPVFRRTVATIASSVASSVEAVTSPADSTQTPDPNPVTPDAGVTIHRQAGPLSSAQLGAPLVHGTFVIACGAPDDMKVVVKAAVKMGHAVHVNVKTDPPNPTVKACIERATRDLQWDVSPKTDHVTVTY